jgi:serine/threonine-protein kinase
LTDLRDQLQATLGDCYSIDRELCGGGMSRVFVARDTTLGRDVVIKVIAPENDEGLSAERFAREVKFAARLQQANIVPVLAAGTSGNLPYYTMPFVRGESLRARLASGTALGTPEAMSILHDVARALAYAHAEHVVHRDIKPETADGYPVYAITKTGRVYKLTHDYANDRSNNPYKWNMTSAAGCVTRIP